MKGWFEAVRILEDPADRDHARAIEIACKFNGNPGGRNWKISVPCRREEYEKMASGMRYADEADNRAFFRSKHGGRSVFHTQFTRGQDFWFDLGRLTTKTRPEDGDGSSLTLQFLDQAGK
jgi:hypothetical protein